MYIKYNIHLLKIISSIHLHKIPSHNLSNFVGRVLQIIKKKVFIGRRLTHSLFRHIFPLFNLRSLFPYLIHPLSLSLCVSPHLSLPSFLTENNVYFVEKWAPCQHPIMKRFLCTDCRAQPTLHRSYIFKH